MELSLEAYRIIVNNIQSRADLAILCLVSRAFRRVAERALYNTLYMRQVGRSRTLCEMLTGQPRIAALVEALDIAIELDERPGDGGASTVDEDEEEGEGGEDGKEDDSGNEVEDRENSGEDERIEMAPALALSLDQSDARQDIWLAISRSLQNMSGLQHLNIFINGLSSPGNLSWILTDCHFRLKSFHSDMKWDEGLVQFLNGQSEVVDLYLGDYDEGEESLEGKVDVQDESQEHQSPSPGHHQSTLPTPTSGGNMPVSARPQLVLSSFSLPRLTTLECTFSEAAIALVPGRPVSRLKTCFTSTDPAGKSLETQLLFTALAKASIVSRSGMPSVSLSPRHPKSARDTKFVGGWLALDIADAEYEEDFSMELLQKVVSLTLTGVRPRSSAKGTLRYLGTLVLPVGGTELRRLCSIELEVSSWHPSPASLGAVAFRALSNELRLYCPGIIRIVFISMSPSADVGERTTVEYVKGEAVARVDRETMYGNGIGLSESLWRDA
ncbi:hypothetical protein D9757_007149 [Collybiopsis confluens]|uniref:F-box domain-containing protein n=1 Tax=Collybiopsis confluens TaxID=2823264 RepID=A0A8H5HCE2_9AGAR|nr:hypothetical protein D9757_007149 [Collybiopsis confluens]